MIFHSYRIFLVMTKNLASILILLSFAFNFTNEIIELSFDHYNSHKTTLSLENTDSVQILNCLECDESECNTENGHCAHHCSGLHTFFDSKQNIKINFQIADNSKPNWSISFNYNGPFLDPALKPPLFS